MALRLTGGARVDGHHQRVDHASVDRWRFILGREIERSSGEVGTDHVRPTRQPLPIAGTEQEQQPRHATQPTAHFHSHHSILGVTVELVNAEVARVVGYCPRVDRVDLLAANPIFEGISRPDLAELAREMTERAVRNGEMVMNLGEVSSSMFIVLDGQLNIHLPGEASRRVSLKDISTGEYFGEMALFDEKPRSASVQATTDGRLLELSREQLSDYLTARPRVAMQMLRVMATRLRETNVMLSQRASRNVNEELEKNLTWRDKLADRVAELNGSWTFIVALLGLTGVWTIVNSLAIFRASFDPYPYVFFNLLLAILVALQGPLIVMSQNRQTIKDRATAKIDFEVNLKNEVHIETILRELGEMRAEVNGRLEALEKPLLKKDAS